MLDVVGIGESIRGRRKPLMTQEEFAAKLDLSQSSISQWERGDSLPSADLLPRIHRLEKGSENPTLETLDKLATALEIDVSYLLAPRSEKEPGRVGAAEDHPVLAHIILAGLDADTPAEDSWRGDVLKAIAVLNRALRRPPATGDVADGAAKAGR